MKKIVLITFVAVSCTLMASGQSQSEAVREARQIRDEMVKQHRLERRAQNLSSKQLGRSISVSEPTSLTDATVGEASSFNKNARFFGTATSGVILVEPNCDPLVLGFELGPDDRCLEVTDPAATTVGTYNDIGRITIPAKTADNIVYLIANHGTSFVFLNFTDSPVSALGTYIPSVTIESEALNDPAAIDPNTNLPMNGSYTTTGLGTKSVNRTLATGSVDIQNESYSRANTNGFSRTFWAALGLPDSVINEIYKKPMTIKLNVTVRVRRVESGIFTFSTRLLAN